MVFLLIQLQLSAESADCGEHGSMGAGSTAASDISWEQVEERDAQMTLWVPDHAVTHCSGCDQEFWIVRRKHHCRYVVLDYPFS